MTVVLTNRDQVLHHLAGPLADAGLDEESLRTDYSGRFMYGRRCVGLVCTLTELCRFVAELGRALGLMYENELTNEELAAVEDTEAVFTDALRDVRSDSMGLNTIWYFPNVEVTS